MSASITLKLVCFVAALVLLMAGCSNKDSAVDPRDQYVGTYNVTITSGKRTLNTTIKFSKANTANDLVFMDNTGDHPASLNGSDFTIYMHSIAQNAFGEAHLTSRHGGGKFEENSVRMTTYTGNSEYPDIVCEYIGTRQ